MHMKRCSKCGKDKPESEFYKRGGNRLDFQSECKMCNKYRSRNRKQYYKNYNFLHKKERKKYYKNYNFLHREEQKQYYQDRKEYYIKWGRERLRKIKIKYIKMLGGKCSMCKLKLLSSNENACIFDFHHEKPISKPANKRLGTENSSNKNFDITKVILLCANCHRLKHYCKRDKTDG